MKIARALRTDKRSKMRVKADILATKVILHIDNLSLKLSHVEATRIASTLDKAVNIQLTHRKMVVPSTQIFSKQEVIIKEKLPELTTLERRLEICRYAYRVIKEKHQEIPKYRKTKIVAHSINNCNSTIGTASAHAHHKERNKFSQRICIKQKYLLRNGDFNSTVDSFANTMAHEIGHLMIKSCRHCNKWRQTYLKFHKTIKESITSGEFFKNMPQNLKE